MDGKPNISVEKGINSVGKYSQWVIANGQNGCSIGHDPLCLTLSVRDNGDAICSLNFKNTNRELNSYILSKDENVQDSVVEHLFVALFLDPLSRELSGEYCFCFADIYDLIVDLDYFLAKRRSELNRKGVRKNIVMTGVGCIVALSALAWSYYI